MQLFYGRTIRANDVEQSPLVHTISVLVCVSAEQAVGISVSSEKLGNSMHVFANIAHY